MSQPYQPGKLGRDELDQSRGQLLLDFGTDWCGHCMAARAAVDAFVEAHPELAHVRIEDGRGRPSVSYTHLTLPTNREV